MIKETIEWYSLEEKLPEYKDYYKGIGSVNVLIKIKNQILRGLFIENKFEVDFVDVTDLVGLWTYYPKGE